MKSLLVAAILAGLTATGAALAQADHSGHGAPAAAKAGNMVNSGEIKRINTDANKVTIAHGPLKAFDMPAMTMAFPVKDPAMLRKLKLGDKVNFVLEKSGEDLVITRIDPVR